MFSLYDISVPIFLRGLGNLSNMLHKAEEHAKASNIDPDAWLSQRLAVDMQPFAFQIHLATNTCKNTLERVGVDVAKENMPEDETTFAQLRERVARTIAFLERLPKDCLDGQEDVKVLFPIPQGVFTPNPGKAFVFTGTTYITQYAVPNFFFHQATAYGILRHLGVKLGKFDFLGKVRAIPN